MMKLLSYNHINPSDFKCITRNGFKIMMLLFFCSEEEVIVQWKN